MSDFRLDKYEVTIGRFRKFVEAAPPLALPEGAGAQARTGRGGWSGVDTDMAPKSWDYVRDLLGRCSLWTENAGADETKPITCLEWALAFRFCVWDAGRLPTEAEWEYAAAGGSEQRLYPWGPARPATDTTLAVYGCLNASGGPTCNARDGLADVGSAALGAGKWGHLDLAGNAEEWTRDFNAFPFVDGPCVDCVNTTRIFPPIPPGYRGPIAGLVGPRLVHKGGGFASAVERLTTAFRATEGSPIGFHQRGVRCARDI